MLTKKQLDMVLALVYTEQTDKDIMTALSIPNTTYYRWKKDPEFVQEVDKEQNRYLKQLAQKAMRRLNTLMNSEKESIAVLASKILIDKGIDTVQKQEITVESNGLAINISYGDDEK